MATGESSVTTLSEDLAGAIQARHGFDELVLGNLLAGGYANDVFRADADGATYVVRVKRRPVDIAGLAWEHRLLLALAPRLDEVVAPIAATAGSTFFQRRDDAVAPLRYVEGAPAKPDRDTIAAAEALARFHRAASDLDLPPRPVLVRLAELRGAIRVGPLLRCQGPRANPVPPAVAERAAEIDAAQKWALDVVSAYRDAGGTVPPTEDELLVPLVRVRRILEVIRAPYDRHVDWDYQLANLDAFERLG